MEQRICDYVKSRPEPDFFHQPDDQALLQIHEDIKHISFVSIYPPHRRGLSPRKTVMYVLQGAESPCGTTILEGQDHDRP